MRPFLDIDAQKYFFLPFFEQYVSKGRRQMESDGNGRKGESIGGKREGGRRKEDMKDGLFVCELFFFLVTIFGLDFMSQRYG